MDFRLLDRFADDALARAWSGSEPFSHWVLDGFVAPEHLLALRGAAEEEPLVHQADEHFQFRGSGEPCSTPLLRTFAEQLGAPAVRERLHALTGLATRTLSLRAYRYLRGDYLLPHTDWQPREQRRIAFAYYLGAQDAAADRELEGGELVLYRCALERDEQTIASAAPAVTIASRPNRIAFFAVTPGTLHRVCEVTRGERLSLAGWFVA